MLEFSLQLFISFFTVSKKRCSRYSEQKNFLKYFLAINDFEILSYSFWNFGPEKFQIWIRKYGGLLVGSHHPIIQWASKSRSSQSIVLLQKQGRRHLRVAAEQPSTQFLDMPMSPSTDLAFFANESFEILSYMLNMFNFFPGRQRNKNLPDKSLLSLTSKDEHDWDDIYYDYSAAKLSGKSKCWPERFVLQLLQLGKIDYIIVYQSFVFTG
jgi:hypothetical protein